MLRFRIVKALLAGALLLSAFVASASTAHAAWSSNGPLAGVTASGGTTTFIIVASGGSVGLSCTSSSLNTGTGIGLQGPTGPASGSWDAITGIKYAFSNCTVAGFVANVTCSGTTSTLSAVSYSAPAVSFSLKKFMCTITPVSFPACLIAIVSADNGHAFNGTYNNSTSVLAISPTGQTLTASWNSACIFITPRPSMAGVVFNGTYTVTSSPKPVITF